MNEYVALLFSTFVIWAFPGIPYLCYRLKNYFSLYEVIERNFKIYVAFYILLVFLPLFYISDNIISACRADDFDHWWCEEPNRICDCDASDQTCLRYCRLYLQEFDDDPCARWGC
jgi:hypothetical protein